MAHRGSLRGWSAVCADAKPVPAAPRATSLTMAALAQEHLNWTNPLTGTALRIMIGLRLELWCCPVGGWVERAHG